MCVCIYIYICKLFLQPLKNCCCEMSAVGTCIAWNVNVSVQTWISWLGFMRTVKDKLWPKNIYWGSNSFFRDSSQFSLCRSVGKLFDNAFKTIIATQEFIFQSWQTIWKCQRFYFFGITESHQERGWVFVVSKNLSRGVATCSNRSTGKKTCKS